MAGDEKLLDDVRRRAENPGPALDGPVADALRRALREQFDTASARLGTPWAPRSIRETIERMSTMQGGGPLVRTGALELSLTVRGAPHGGQELRDGGRTLELSTDHPGAFAQTGTSRGEPARPIVPDDVPDDLLEEIADRVGDYILEGLV